MKVYDTIAWMKAKTKSVYCTIAIHAAVVILSSKPKQFQKKEKITKVM